MLCGQRLIGIVCLAVRHAKLSCEWSQRAKGRAPVRHSGQGGQSVTHEHATRTCRCIRTSSASPVLLSRPFLPSCAAFCFAPSAQPSNSHVRMTSTRGVYCVCQSFAACFLPLLLPVPSPHSSVAVPSACARWSLSLSCRSNGKRTEVQHVRHTRKKHTGTDTDVLSFLCAHCPPLAQPRLPRSLRRRRCLCSLVRLSPLPSAAPSPRAPHGFDESTGTNDTYSRSVRVCVAVS